MNKSELIASVAEASGLAKKDAERRMQKAMRANEKAESKQKDKSWNIYKKFYDLSFCFIYALLLEPKTSLILCSTVSFISSLAGVR